MDILTWELLEFKIVTFIRFGEMQKNMRSSSIRNMTSNKRRVYFSIANIDSRDKYWLTHFVLKHMRHPHFFITVVSNTGSLSNLTSLCSKAAVLFHTPICVSCMPTGRWVEIHKEPTLESHLYSVRCYLSCLLFLEALWVIF